jgi:SAM-dependent methyltransferase
VMGETPWYQAIFGQDYLRIYGPFLSPERTEQEIEGIVKLLALPAGSTILDLCCGHGRHAIPLAQRGYQVTGQDLSEVFLQQARAAADAQRVQVRWVHGDMRSIPFENEFDAVINIFTAFGYLESDDEDEQVLVQVHKALKPGGLFLLEIIHREGLMRRYAPFGVQRHDDGLIVIEERHFNLLTSRNETRVTMIDPDGQRTEYVHAVRLYTLTELVRLCTAAGLQVQAHYGGLDGSSLTLDSHRLVLVCRKTAPGVQARGTRS